MSTITTEWLQKTIAEFETNCDEIPFGLDDDDAKILQVLKWKLASLDVDPVAEIRAYYPLGIDGGKQKFVQPLGELPDFGTELFASPSETNTKQVAELTMLVKRLAYSLRHAKPGSKLPDDAMSYLSGKGLIRIEDILR